MKVDLKGKVVVITGGASGIGRSISRRLAYEKANVVASYCHSAQDAESLFNGMKWKNNCAVFKADITKAEDVSALRKYTIEKFGKIDVLINNAGVFSSNFAPIMRIDQWNTVIDVNLTGTFIACREFSKRMIHQKKGNIINIASLVGQVGAKGQSNYAASKAGVIALTQTLAKELESFHICVNALCPGSINAKLQNVSNNGDKYLTEIALNDLLNFIVFLSSGMLKGVSGRTFNLDSRYNLN